MIDLSEGETKKQKPKKNHEIILNAFKPHLSSSFDGSKVEIINADNPKYSRIVDIPKEFRPSIQKFMTGSISDEEFNRLLSSSLLDKILKATAEVWGENYNISVRKMIETASRKAREDKLKEARNKMSEPDETEKREKEG